MGYEVIVSKEVFNTVNSIVLYLEKRWSKKVAQKFLYTFYQKVDSIAERPNLGKVSARYATIRKILITKHNMLYYEVNDTDNRIELLNIFFTAQDPAKNTFE